MKIFNKKNKQNDKNSQKSETTENKPNTDSNFLRNIQLGSEWGRKTVLAFFDYVLWGSEEIYYWYTSTERPPVNEGDYEAYERRQADRRKEAILETKKKIRDQSIQTNYKDDLNRLKYKKSIYQNWYAETKRKLDDKFANDRSLYISEQDKEEPQRIPGWVTEDFNRDFYYNKLCESLECTSAKPINFSPDYNTKKDQKVVIRDLKRELASSQKSSESCNNENAHLRSEYERYIKKIDTRLFKLHKTSDKNVAEMSSLERSPFIHGLNFERSPFIHGPNIGNSNPNLQQVDLDLGFWNFLKFPINVAKGRVFKLAEGERFLFATLCRIFELMLASLVAFLYYKMTLGIYHVAVFIFQQLTESTTNRLKNRQELLRHRTKEQQREETRRRKQRSRRTLFKDIHHLAGRLKNIGVSVQLPFRSPVSFNPPEKLIEPKDKRKRPNLEDRNHNMRGGSTTSLDPLFERDLSTLTNMERNQILFAIDPIYLLIQVEKNNLEVQKVVELYQKNKRSNPRQIFKNRNYGYKFIQSKRPVLASLNDKISTIIGSLTFIAAATLSEIESPRYNYNLENKQIPAIERNLNQIPEIMREIEEFEESCQIQLEEPKAKPKKRLKARKHNRKIHRLSDLPSLETEDSNLEMEDSNKDNGIELQNNLTKKRIRIR